MGTQSDTSDKVRRLSRKALFVWSNVENIPRTKNKWRKVSQVAFLVGNGFGIVADVLSLQKSSSRKKKGSNNK